MATEFNDTRDYAFFVRDTPKLTNGNGYHNRWSEQVLASLRASGLFDNMVDGLAPPATDLWWLDKNFDPPVLKEWDPIGFAWVQVTSETLLGRVPWQGAWSSSPIYRRGDIVSYNGSIWIAAQSNQNHTPAEDAFWDLFMSGAIVPDGAVTFPKLATSTWVDEDNMVSDSAVRLPTQQSVKAYVDAGDAALSNLNKTLPADQSAKLAAVPTIRSWDYRWPVFAFTGGSTERAKGSGHATANFQATFQAALGSGEKLEIPAWVYPFRTFQETTNVISIVGDIPIDIDCATGCTLKIGTEVDNVSGSFFRLQASTMPSVSSQIGFKWNGGFFDGSAVNDSPSPGVNMLDIYQYTGASIRNAKFYAGTSTPSGASIGFGLLDSGIVVHNCFGALIDNCDFIGFQDLGVYLTGNNDAGVYDGIGECYTVSNSRFRRCTNAIAMKRDSLGHHINNNFIQECANGILAGAADGSTTNYGETCVITHNRIRKTQGRPIFLQTGRDYIVQGNNIVDWGKQISDGTTFIVAGTRCAGIDGRGISYAIISDNQIRMDAWGGGTASANKEPVAIQLDDDSNANGCSDVLVQHNKIRNVHRTMLETGASNGNYFQENIATLPSSGTALAQSLSGAATTWVGQILTGTLTQDVASIAAGAQTTLTITVTGAAVGDFVVGLSFSRDFSHTQLRDLNMHTTCAADAVQLSLMNNTLAAIDLSNTIWQAQVRKAK